jgi:hypothetical protein
MSARAGILITGSSPSSSSETRSTPHARRGYVTNHEDRRGKPAKLAVAERLPDEVVILPVPDDLCTCAVLTEEGTRGDIEALGAKTPTGPHERQGDRVMAAPPYRRRPARRAGRCHRRSCRRAPAHRHRAGPLVDHARSRRVPRSVRPSAAQAHRDAHDPLRARAARGQVLVRAKQA